MELDASAADRPVASHRQDDREGVRFGLQPRQEVAGELVLGATEGLGAHPGVVPPATLLLRGALVGGPTHSGNGALRVPPM